MKLYLIGGLGADHRVFDFLSIEEPTPFIEWEIPRKKEPLDQYAQRLITQIDTSEEFGILGVSFGGIVAIEISKIVKPRLLIIVSSVLKNDQLSSGYVALGKLGILKLIPNALLKPPKFLSGFLFGTKNKKLLHQIITDTSPTFIRWALNAILQWKNDCLEISTLRIHGTTDKIIPLKGMATEITNGGHFMIVDHAKTISKLIDRHLKTIT